MQRPHLRALTTRERTAVGVATIAGLLFGYDLCVIAGALDLIKNTFDLSTLEEELVVSSVLAGAVVGSLVGGFQAEARGRKPAIVAFTVLFAAGALVMALAPSFAVLILGRVLVGIAVGGSGMSVPVYLAELAPASARGLVIALNEVMICAGCLLAIVVDAVLQHATDGWRFMLGLAIVPALLQLVGLTALPRSPRWLLLHGRVEDARVALRVLRGDHDAADQELERLRAVLDADARATTVSQTSGRRAHGALGKGSGGKGRGKGIPTIGDDGPGVAVGGAGAVKYSMHRDEGDGDGDGDVDVDGDGRAATKADRGDRGTNARPDGALHRERCTPGCAEFRASVRTRPARWQLGVALCTAAAQNLSAANALLYYSARILGAAAGEDEDEAKATEAGTVGVGVAKLSGVCVSLWLIARCGRRSILLGGTLGMGACHTLLAVAFASLPGGETRQAVVTVLLYAFIFVWDLSWAPLMWVTCSELLPAAGRAVGMGIAVACFWGTGVLSNQFLLSLARGVGWAGTFAMWAGLSVVSVLFVFTMIPETRGLPLEAVGDLFRTALEGGTAEGGAPTPHVAPGPGVSAEGGVWSRAVVGRCGMLRACAELVCRVLRCTPIALRAHRGLPRDAAIPGATAPPPAHEAL